MSKALYQENDSSSIPLKEIPLFPACIIKLIYTPFLFTLLKRFASSEHPHSTSLTRIRVVFPLHKLKETTRSQSKCLMYAVTDVFTPRNPHTFE